MFQLFKSRFPHYVYTHCLLSEICVHLHCLYRLTRAEVLHTLRRDNGFLVVCLFSLNKNATFTDFV